MRIDLHPGQLKALDEMHVGCVLKGGVGSGKSITSLAFFFTKIMGGNLNINGKGEVSGFTHPYITQLLIITPPKKRDELEWDGELSRFSLSRDPEISFGHVRVLVDSWNNIQRYTDLSNAFVIFDEQRLVGSGAWVKAFYKIAQNNQWILLSATPGDSWMEFIPVFVANGFYKNRTEFLHRHVVFSRYSKFPKVERYVEEGRLLRLKRRVLVEMPYERHTTRHIKNIPVLYDTDKYTAMGKTKWNIWKDEPIKNVVELISCWRRLVNEDNSRIEALSELMDEHPRLIIYYSFNYELEKLRLFLQQQGTPFSEWNGHKHQAIPDTERWVYLVQYTSGSDAWNCISTNAMVFYSMQYSYKTFEQCQGRIDRLNTLYEDLYYYVFRSASKIDQGIWKALTKKKNFNEADYGKNFIEDF